MMKFEQIDQMENFHYKWYYKFYIRELTLRTVYLIETN